MTAREKRLIQAATKALALMEEASEKQSQPHGWSGLCFIVRRKDWQTTIERLRKALELNALPRQEGDE